ncbi:STAS domain-containing protein [Rossellomorea vietnamensis]|uniref:STAS domain-containing protein n=1 Tax=Rossellomorea aquimaris TaxID=189382 RepID=A0A5D4U6R7_9BACI|nr:STAS domain-containing protein [Rossellomorea aquimaris]TYS82801.1 STAS domain-containing protein [Rossellomorea aquimaris]
MFNEKVYEEFCSLILEKSSELAHEVTEIQTKKYPEMQSISNDLLSMREELVSLFAKSFVMSNEDRKKNFKAWGKKAGTQCATLNASLEEMLNEFPEYRTILGDLLKTHAKKHDMTIDGFYNMLNILETDIGDVTCYFSLPFVDYQADQLRNSKEALFELSVPVIPISDEIAVLPLVGDIDTGRAKLMLEKALEKSAKLKVKYFILDLSGVPIIDTYVAQIIFQLIDSLELIGVEAKVTGMTPDIVQTVVNLGIDFKKIQTYSSLKQAINTINGNETQRTV